MKRILFSSICITLLCMSCGLNRSKDIWIVDHYYSKADDPIPVQPLRISACYFGPDRVLRKFILQDVTWTHREIGQLFYLDDRLHRIVLEDEYEELLFEVQIEYDASGDQFKLINPQERTARGSNMISEPMVRDLILQGLKKDDPENCMDIFRLRVNADAYDQKTDRIPQEDLSALQLDSLIEDFGGQSALVDYDFRINTRDYQVNFYERALRIKIKGVPPEKQEKDDKELVAKKLRQLVGGDEVLSSFNTYEIAIDDDELIEAGGFGLMDKPDRKIILNAWEVFATQ